MPNTVIVNMTTGEISYEDHDVSEVQDLEACWRIFRQERDALLKVAIDILDRHRNQNDYGLISTLTDDQALEWAVYAQTLRDLSVNTENPSVVVWPVIPDTN